MQPTIVRSERMPAETPEVSVAIVGAGACGLTAAVALRDAGLDCVLLERDARPGGSTALSSGFIPAAGTRVQEAAGVTDTVTAFAADILAKCKHTAPQAMVLAYAAAVPKAIDRLCELGIAFELLDGFLYPGHHARRMHAVAERSGAALLGQMFNLALRQGADVLLQARVVELWADGQDRVIGVGFERPDGRVEHLACRVLLLACNGYGGNPARVHAHIPEMRQAVYAGHVGNDGSALAWGEMLGAAVADLSGYQGHGSWVVPQGMLMTWAVMTQGGLQLNACGKRFHDETAGYSEAAVHVLAQPGGVAWNVFGQAQWSLAREFPEFREAEALGAVHACADRAELARHIGCAEANLDTAVDRLAPPLGAVRVTGALFHTQGGLVVDQHTRVQRIEGGSFPNLWAAGGAARGVSGPHVWGYLSGNGLLSAVAGAWIAAHAIARELRGGCQ